MNRAWSRMIRWVGSATIVAGLATALLGIPAALAQPDIEGETVVLAAVPEFRHPYWVRTVILAAPIPTGGHLGLILNRPTNLSLSSVFPEHAPSKSVQAPVYFGGPVSAEAIVALLARAEPPGDGAVQLGERLYLAYGAKLIDRIIEQTPNDARYFFGLVIWLPGELRDEIGRGLWTLHAADSNTLFRRDTERLWLDLYRPARGLRVRWPHGGRHGDASFFADGALSLSFESVRSLRLFHRDLKTFGSN